MANSTVSIFAEVKIDAEVIALYQQLGLIDSEEEEDDET